MLFLPLWLIPKEVGWSSVLAECVGLHASVLSFQKEIISYRKKKNGDE